MLGSFESKLVEDYIMKNFDPAWVAHNLVGNVDSHDKAMMDSHLDNVERQKTPRQHLAEENNFPKFYFTFEGGYLLDGCYLIIRAPYESTARGLMYSQFEYNWSNCYREEDWLDISIGNMRYLGEF